MLVDSHNWIDITLGIWFSLTAVSVIYVAWDLITRTPEMKVMKWGWVLVTLYAGPVAFIVYWLSCREPAPGSHEEFIAPLWKQSVGSTIHCMAGDATGIIVAATITSLLGLPMGLDAAVEYIAGFAFGLLIFQALFMKDMLGGSYWQAVKATWLPEWLSMNAVMAGMIPVMIVLMTRDMSAMEPTSLRFWGVMSLATLVGALLAYPINWWLVKNHLKHGMGTERALGKGGTKLATGQSRLDLATSVEHVAPGNRRARNSPASSMTGMERASVSVGRKLVVTFITIIMLAGGVALALLYGNSSMRAGGSEEFPMAMLATHCNKGVAARGSSSLLAIRSKTRGTRTVQPKPVPSCSQWFLTGHCSATAAL